MLFSLIILIAMIAGFLIGWVIKKNSNNSAQFQELNIQQRLLEQELNRYQDENKKLKDESDRHFKDLNEAENKITKLRVEINFKEEQLKTQKEEIEHIGEKFENQFKVLANSILEEKGQKFTEQQEHNLKAILDPLRQKIENFKKEFEEKFLFETKDRASLLAQVKQMMELNKLLTDQANNLTQVLRGNVKQQGNWGEMILESILEYAGLQKDIHYFVQQRTQNAGGQIIQPDIIVKYPDDRAIVIDSKVSLVHYESYCSSIDENDKARNITLMLQSFKNHIDGLSAKAYHEVTNALDFVVMFIPVEPAYIAAMHADNNLWQYAYSKRILLISPTNLIAAMKLVNDLWKRDTINKDAHKIAEKAGKLYDKLVGFLDNFQKVGVQIDKANSIWSDAFKQLSKGRGNLISQAEQIKGFRFNKEKELPKSLVEEALMEDNSGQPIDDAEGN